MLVLVAWGVWKTALRFGLRQRNIAVDATLALGWRQATESPLPKLAFNTTIHICEWVGLVDCVWGTELQAEPQQIR